MSSDSVKYRAPTLDAAYWSAAEVAGVLRVWAHELRTQRATVAARLRRALGRE